MDLFCEKGYYVFSPLMTMDLFKGESAYDSEMFINGDLKKFRFYPWSRCLYVHNYQVLEA